MTLRQALPFLALAAAACGRRASRTGAPTEFVDAEGRPVTVSPLPVKRIVSTMQSATEWLVLLGAADHLVARTAYDHEPSLAALPSIGGGLDPSPEAIASLHPDVVLGWHNRSSVDLQHALQRFHVPVLSFETTDTADLFRNLARLGDLVAAPARADSLAGALRQELREVRATACPDPSADTATVFVEVWTDPPITAGSGTWVNTVLETACLRNLFADLPAPWPTVSLEAIRQRQPDWVLTSSGAAPGARLAELRAKPGWRELAAVRAGRVLEIPADLLARAGPSVAEAARAIAAARRAHAPR